MVEDKVLRFALSGDDYRKLVAGEVIKFDTLFDAPFPEIKAVEITLSDIGFAVMKHYISEAEKARDDREKEKKV